MEIFSAEYAKIFLDNMKFIVIHVTPSFHQNLYLQTSITLLTPYSILIYLLQMVVLPF